MEIKQIGRYQIKELLGQGGMALVYRAYDDVFQRDVAVKLLAQTQIFDPHLRQRFEREARTIARLEHAAIVPVYEFGEHDGMPYFVMRLMEGGTLTEKLEKGALPLTDIVEVFRRLAPAIDLAHAQGIVHRDLKPGNILFGGGNNAYLSDFGIVKSLASDAKTLTATGGIVGTPAYMSPEQVRGAKDLDGRSDIYALGTILFQMLTGRLPYQADTPISAAFKHVTDPVPRVLDVAPHLPVQFGAIINRAMAKEPEERYQTCLLYTSPSPRDPE